MSWEIFAKMKAGTVLLLAVVLVFAGGCAVSRNNHRSMAEMVNHLKSSGIKITKLQPVRPEPFKASEGVALQIENQDIGLYKYDLNFEKQKTELKRISGLGYVSIQQWKLPVVINGSFLFLGVESNPKKHELLKAIDSF
ncbi:MAG: hypothetical protein PHS41_04305 [Victivallaceae bacterium]|nr:hypothetical protein [Victivallaceae bacterium]